MKIYLTVLTAVLLTCLLSAAGSRASTVPGAGGTGDPTLNEGIAYSVALTTAGDVVICEVASPCSATDPSTWSDVLVFYSFFKGPFLSDLTLDARFAYVFSDDTTGFGSLSNFVTSGYDAFGLSPNHQVITENPNGLTDYGSYFVNSPEVASAAEPGSVLLLGVALLGIGLLMRRTAVC